MPADQIQNTIHEQFRAYRETLQDDRRHLLERFEVVDVARKVVGVGSVGTRAFIVLLQGRDQHDPLFLQVKEATASVLEDHLPKSRYEQPGERVVQGQRMMQAASDIFLGWTKGVQENRYLYWRQLRDMKGSAVVENMVPEALDFYAGLCGKTLARAHARSGDPIAIAAYLGKKTRFDESITDFAERYADQNERDFEAFTAAITSGSPRGTRGRLSILPAHPRPGRALTPSRDHALGLVPGMLLRRTVVRASERQSDQIRALLSPGRHRPSQRDHLSRPDARMSHGLEQSPMACPPRRGARCHQLMSDFPTVRSPRWSTRRSTAGRARTTSRCCSPRPRRWRGRCSTASTRRTAPSSGHGRSTGRNVHRS